MAKRQYQIELDEWTGRVWERRITTPMHEAEAEEHYLQLAKYQGIRDCGQTRNVVIREVVGQPIPAI